MSLFSGKRGEVPDETAPARETSGAPVEAQPRPAARAQGGKGVADIGKSIAFKGDLSGDEDLVIEGSVEGKVSLPNNQLTIGADGRAQAEITAKTVIVVGRVVGNVNGTERVEIQATGKVQGDITAPKLVVAEGAEVNGAIRMTETPAARPSPQPGKAQTSTAAPGSPPTRSATA